MKRFGLFFNGKVVGSFNSERAARYRFLQKCAVADYESDSVWLADLESDGEIIAKY